MKRDKLRLNKETIRNLSDEHLGEVAGGKKGGNHGNSALVGCSAVCDSVTICQSGILCQTVLAVKC